MWVVVLLLPVLAWARLPCFERIRSHRFVGHTIVTKSDISLAKCELACLQMEADRCRAVTYSARGGLCELHRSDKDRHHRALFPATGATDYYHRTCYEKPSAAILRDDASLADKCYETTPGKVLIGIVDQQVKDLNSVEECWKACQRSQERFDITCKSAAYYAKDKECIIASQSRHDIPDLFIDDENSVYIENVCLTGAGDNVKKISSKTTSGSGAFEGLETMGKIVPPEVKTPKTERPPLVEQSGYDSSVDGSASDTKDMPPSAMPTPAVATVNPKVVDSYAVEATSKSSNYGRRLRDERVRTCFREVRPLQRMVENRVSKAYSLEQCTDICRLCHRCLRGKKCQSVAFDRSKELCALSLSPLIDGGEDGSDVIYHNRANC